MKKKLFSLVLAFALCLGLTVPAFANGHAVVGRSNPISTGAAHAYIDTNHSLWTFGSNDRGQLGNGSHTEPEFNGGVAPREMTPTKVLDNVRSVTATNSATYAIMRDDSLWVWGYNFSGGLGFEGGNDNAYPGYITIQNVPYKLMDNVAAVCADDCTAVIKKDGSLWGWGWPLTGDDDYKMKKYADNVIAASVDLGQLAYVTADHTLWVVEGMGDDTPKRVMSDVIDTAIGYDFVFAIKSDHSLWAWGGNEKGQLGIGSREPSDTPVKILDGVRQIDIGDRNIGAVKLDNSLWVWGDNTACQLGTTKADFESSGMINPYKIIWTPVKLMDDVAYVDMHYLTVVKTDGSYWTNYLHGGYNIRRNGELVRDPNITVALDTSLGGSSTTPTTPDILTVNGFTDVKSTDYYADAVQWAVEKNITSGTSKTTFSPGATCNRAQILSFLWRASGSPEPTADNLFTDIKPSDYFYKAALWAAEKGMVSGSSFGASTPCTRASTMEYMWKAAGSPAASYNGKFDDVSTSADYAQAVAWAVANGVTAGTSETTFGPDSTCTRGQIVTFLHRAMGD